ncbi:MAG: putative UTP--glucose-1-phosphate uridylyltransferase YngB [Chitinophagales bacterium]|nr:MAG: putative UTP--glucose-1-phosphate uridylyltransferase YngB [Chitinophagales bacterium]
MHYKQTDSPRITKAVIPAAGKGTRLLPATKAQPKEMLPVVDKPVIQYVVEEAVASGIRDILIIIAPGKETLQRHFAPESRFKQFLQEKSNSRSRLIAHLPAGKARIHFAYQNYPRGLGDAIRCAEEFVANEPFAVLLGDTIITTHRLPLTRQLMDIYAEYHSPVAALEKVLPALAHRYGIFRGEKITGNLFQAVSLEEKPRQHIRSPMAVAGRYILTPDIFHYLKNLRKGVNHEIQLTDALRFQAASRRLLGLLFEGTRYDVGNRLDFLKTNILFGMEHPETGKELRKWLSNLTRRKT